MTLERGAQHFLGIALTAASAVAYSTAGFFTHLIALDPWTILFWRGIFAGIFIAGFILWQNRGATLAAVRAIGWPGIAVAACSTLATICFINAFRRTSVADVTIIFATAPFLTAALAYLWIGERENWTTLAASAASLVGIVVMVGGAASAGHLSGDLLALAMTLAMAVMMIIIREHRETPMLPASCLSAFLSALAVLPLAAPASPDATAMLYLALFGTTQFGLGLLLLTLGTRLISATEAALVSAIETPLAPLWVWLAFAEIPSWPTVVGGIIVMAAVAAHIVTSARQAD
jgi:drug/metabolite transporter (DMT)-like permease